MAVLTMEREDPGVRELLTDLGVESVAVGTEPIMRPLLAKVLIGAVWCQLS